MERFYFTYGTSKNQPFVGGWTTVEAPSLDKAIKTFRKAHPDHIKGLVNCAFIYEEAEFNAKPMSSKGNFGSFEHERLVFDNSRKQSKKSEQ